MKIGVISDVHGNLPALEAILALLDGEGCDEILHLGDAISIGPFSRECVELLLSRKDVTCLLGNHDRDFVLGHAELRQFSHVPAQHKQQVFASLNEQLRGKMAQFPLYVTRKCGTSTLLFAHYALLSPLPDGGYPFAPIVTEPTAERFDEAFGEAACDAVFFGHKHEPCDIASDKRLYVDVGSVGCHQSPFARGVVIECDGANWNYRRVCAPYDMGKTRDALLRMPCGKQLFDFYYLRLGA